MGDEFKELFKRSVERYQYMYARANTKSKKKEIAFDLIFFDNMYNYLVSEKVDFPWGDDIELTNARFDIANGLIENVMEEQNILKKIFYNNFKIFIENNFSLFTDYFKNYHSISETLMIENIGDFLGCFDELLVDRFESKLENSEICINNTISKYDGLTYSLEAINKNIIMFSPGRYFTIDNARVLVHELGHDFEFENAKKSGINSLWSKIAKTLYVEACPCFFEYAFINYLIDNRIYYDDALMLQRRFLNQVYYYLSYALTIMNIRNMSIDIAFDVTLKTDDVVNYANHLLTKMNSSIDLYKIGDKLNFRTSLIYAMGKLLGIYIYEVYKNNPKDFLSKFRKVLIEYKDKNFGAFESIGITEEMLMDGYVLKKILKDVNSKI